MVVKNRIRNRNPPLGLTADVWSSMCAAGFGPENETPITLSACDLQKPISFLHFWNHFFTPPIDLAHFFGPKSQKNDPSHRFGSFFYENHRPIKRVAYFWLHNLIIDKSIKVLTHFFIKHIHLCSGLHTFGFRTLSLDSEGFRKVQVAPGGFRFRFRLRFRFKLSDWQTEWPSDWQTEWLTDTDWMTHWVTEWLSDWQTESLTDWVTNRLSDW